MSGHSGIVLASILSHTMGLPMLIVRKQENPTPHDGLMVNGYQPEIPIGGALRYLIIDDLISSGRTIERIIYQIKHLELPVRVEAVGVLLWNSNGNPDFTREFFPNYHVNRSNEWRLALSVYHMDRWARPAPVLDSGL